MDEIINFQIKTFGPINEADMDIGKINIVGGNNATGKSTASKLLYCFLKASSNKRQDFAYDSLSKSLTRILSRFNDDLSYSQIRNMDLVELLDEYERSRNEYVHSPYYDEDKFMFKEINDMDNSIKEIQENGESLYLSILNNLLGIEFSSSNLKGHASFNSGFKKYLYKGFNYLGNFSFDVSTKSRGLIDVYDVFYIDSFSIFDLNRIPSSIRLRRQGYYNHVEYLRLMLKESEDESKELFDDKKNKNIIDVENKVKDIIGGKIEFNKGKFTYVSNNSEPYSMENTASGIKQIGVIQLLLSNRKLKEGSFLIIDEPEVNLHPEWQFKLAEILILLVKELNISIYVNTHSPMFIEAIEVFTKYYDLEEDTYYYLTELAENGFNFKYIDVDDLYEIYDKLSKPYSAIEGYRIKSKYRN